MKGVISSKKAILFAFAILAAVCAALFLQKKSGVQPGTCYIFEAGKHQSFAMAGEGLASMSETAVQLSTPGGALTKQLAASARPTAVSNGAAAVLYDAGGSELYIASGDALRTVDTGRTVLSVSAGENGGFAVCTTQPGYKGAVTVYDASCEPVYRWCAKSGYPLCAALSPDGAYLAVLCAGPGAGTVHIFDLGSESEYAVCDIQNDLPFDLGWTDDGLLVISEKAVYAVSGKGRLCADYEFSGELGDYAFHEDGAAVVLYGERSAIVSLDFYCRVQGTMELSSSVQSICAKDGSVLILSGGTVCLTDEKLNIYGSAEAGNAVLALLTDNKNALVISKESAAVTEIKTAA